MRYDILNDSGTISGELGKGWTAYSLDGISGDVKVIGHVDAASTSVNDQLTALYQLQSKIIQADPNVLLRDMVITGESLSLAETTQSPVKQWILSKMSRP